MGKRISIDIGTTCTKVCHWDDGEGAVEDVRIDPGSYVSKVPSVVVKSGVTNEYWFGNEALEHMRDGNDDCTVYNAFKIMPAEDDGDVLKSYNYDGGDSPKEIYKEYLRYIVESYLEENASSGKDYKAIDKIVACTPIIWNEARNRPQKAGEDYIEVSSIDIKPRLFEIFEEFFADKNPDVEIDIIDEPTAACAYFADRAAKEKGKPFKGHMLIVDYGGGTLDIALCKVEPLKEKNEDGTLKTSIKPIYTEGDGYNTTGKAGSAGMAFFQSLLERAIKAKTGEDIAVRDGEYWDAYKTLENGIMRMSARIREKFQAESSVDDCMGIKDPLEKVKVMYKKQQLDITYGDLASCFIDVIRPTFEQKLESIKKTAQSCGIDMDDTERFKIALVGGFGNFDLTKKCIADVFDIFYDGGSFINLSGAKSAKEDDERNYAVARGACLYARELMKIEPVAKYSIGVKYENNGVKKPMWAFRIGDSLELNEKKPVSYEMNGKPTPLYGSRIEDFAFEFIGGKVVYRNPYEGYKDLFKWDEERVFYTYFSVDRKNRLKVTIEFLDPKTGKILKDMTMEKVFDRVNRLLSGDGLPIKAE